MLRVETDYSFSFQTTQPVSMKTEGGVTTVTIEGTAGAPPGQDGLAEVRRPRHLVEDLLPVPRPSRSGKPRCGQTMARSGQPCARVAGHNGVHMTAEQIQRKQDYNKRRARERYAEDPDYANHVRAQVRKSYARKGGAG